MVKIDIDSFDCDILASVLQSLEEAQAKPPSILLVEVYDGIPPPFEFSQRWKRAPSPSSRNFMKDSCLSTSTKIFSKDEGIGDRVTIIGKLDLSVSLAWCHIDT